MHEALNNALERFWLATWNAALEARLEFPDSEDQEATRVQSYNLFRKLAPSIDFTRTNSNSPSGSPVIRPNDQKSPQIRARKLSLELTTIETSSSTKNPLRHRLITFDKEHPKGQIVTDLPDCRFLRAIFTYNGDNFDIKKHQLYKRDERLSRCGDGEVIRKSEDGETIIEHHRNEIVPHFTVTNTQIARDVRMGIATPWKLLHHVTCPICFLPIRESSTIVGDLANETFGIKVPPCGHVICSVCLRACKQISRRCPTCRGPIMPAYDLRPHIF